MTNPSGKIVLVNAQTEKLFGYARAELLGKPVELLIPARHRERHVAHRAAFSRAPSARAMGAGRDLFGLRKDGAEVPIEIGLNPLSTPDGSFVLASIIDITQRRVLERKVAHTEVLASIGTMAAAVAHEIRNPLNSIILAAKAFAHGGLRAEEFEQVKAVLVNESARLNRTLEDFLEFSRARAPKLESGDLNATVREVLENVRADKALLGKARVDVDLDAALPRLPHDPDQLRQVLWNLVRNALQALGGKGCVSVRTAARHGSALLVVEDDGPGIPPEQAEKVFAPFFTTKPQGTGLGLSISRNIVRAHGGDIELDAAPRRGTRFTVILPLAGAR
jgi:PAS domain S-box-containing protein